MGTYTDSGIDYVYEDTNFTATVSSGTAATGSVSILSSFIQNSNTYTVITINTNAFLNNTNLVGVTIPSTITSIPNQCFLGCTSLASVTLNSNVTDIGYASFSNCTSLQTINLFNVVTIFGSAFEGSGLTSITIPSTVTSLNSNAFNCSSLTNVTVNVFSSDLPSAFPTTSITHWTFNYAGAVPRSVCNNKTNVTSVTLNNITSIEDQSFFGTRITSIDFSNSPNLISIGGYAFANISTLTSFTIPSSITTLGASFLDNCSSLATVTINSYIADIGSALVGFTGSSNGVAVTFNYANVVPDSCFNGKTNIKTVTCSSGITDTGISSFEGCTKLDTITLASTVTSIGSNSFKNCTSLTSFTIPSTVTLIKDGAFSGSGLTSVTIPSTITTVDSGAFGSCASLTNVEVQKRLNNLGNIFTGSSIQSYYFNFAGTIPNSCCANFTSLQTVTFNNGITFLGLNCFQNCSALQSVDLSNTSMVVIGSYAFNNCSQLRNISFPFGLDTIGDYAFQGCTALNQNGIDDLANISDFGFYSFDNSGLTDVFINDGVTVNDYAFSNLSQLRTVEILQYLSNLSNIFSNSNGTTWSFDYEGEVPAGCCANKSLITSISVSRNITSIGNSAF